MSNISSPGARSGARDPLQSLKEHDLIATKQSFRRQLRLQQAQHVVDDSRWSRVVRGRDVAVRAGSRCCRWRGGLNGSIRS